MAPMPSTVVDVRQLTERFAELVALAAAGGDVIIAEGSVPRARLVALGSGRARQPGLHRGAITTTPDFDEPLPDEFWTGAP
jgi:antitoxin (DNA-binding transcriptional repressor) of toxin-antitoxin stability system